MVQSFDVTFTLDFAIVPEGDYVATCPELPGFSASGRDLDTAWHWARMKIIGYLDEREDAGDPVPFLRYTAAGEMAPARSGLEHPGFAA
jgi:predicted RNase H-like HicB family nuclease